MGDCVGAFSRFTGKVLAGAVEGRLTWVGVCAVDDNAKGINTPSNPDATGRIRRRLLLSFIVIGACKLLLAWILALLFTIAQTGRG
ncbi:hypothetical protein D3C81_1302000 [compost metagenome]